MYVLLEFGKTKFQSFIYSHNFDVIAITETWLSNSIFDNEILPTNYKIYRNDCGSRGGELFLQYQTLLLVKFSPPPTDIEMLSVKAELSQSTIICVVYLPPLPTLSQIESLSYHLS